MTTIQSLVVLAIGINVGIVLHICWEELKNAIVKMTEQFLADQEAKDNADMDAAVALTQEKLGGTILDYGPNV